MLFLEACFFRIIEQSGLLDKYPGDENGVVGMVHFLGHFNITPLQNQYDFHIHLVATDSLERHLRSRHLRMYFGSYHVSVQHHVRAKLCINDLIITPNLLKKDPIYIIAIFSFKSMLGDP